MSSAIAGYEHVTINDKGVPVVGTHEMKISQLVSEHFAWGWSPEELHLNHPYLSLGEIHSALAYYWDHKDDIDGEIERDLVSAAEIRVQMGQPSLIDKLKSRGLI